MPRMSQRSVPLAVLSILLVTLSLGCFYVVDPGERGVKVTLGKMSDDFIPPGFGTKLPIVTQIWRINVQQDTREIAAECFSSDLQQINIRLKVLYRIPEVSAIPVLRDYA